MKLIRCYLIILTLYHVGFVILSLRLVKKKQLAILTYDINGTNNI
jgi:hypothetical protein